MRTILSPKQDSLWLSQPTRNISHGKVFLRNCCLESDNSCKTYRELHIASPQIVYDTLSCISGNFTSSTIQVLYACTYSVILLFKQHDHLWKNFKIPSRVSWNHLPWYSCQQLDQVEGHHGETVFAPPAMKETVNSVCTTKLTSHIHVY